MISTSIVNNFEKGELKAVIAHELWHWQQGDGIGYMLFRWCSWELVLIYNIAKFGRGDKNSQGAKLNNPGFFGDSLPFEGEWNYVNRNNNSETKCATILVG